MYKVTAGAHGGGELARKEYAVLCAQLRDRVASFELEQTEGPNSDWSSEEWVGPDYPFLQWDFERRWEKNRQYYPSQALPDSMTECSTRSIKALRFLERVLSEFDVLPLYLDAWGDVLRKSTWILEEVLVSSGYGEMERVELIDGDRLEVLLDLILRSCGYDEDISKFIDKGRWTKGTHLLSLYIRGVTMKSPSLGHQGLRRSWAQVQTGVPQELHAEASIVFGHYKTQNPYLSLIDTVRPERRDEAWKYCLAAFVNTNAQNEILPCLAAAFAGRPNIGADEQFARVQEVMEVLVHRITVSSHRKRIPGLTVPVIDSFPSGLRQYLVNQLIGASEKDIRFQLETDYRTAGQVLEALQGMLGDLDELLASEKSNDDDVGRVLTRLDGILGDFLAAFAGKDLTKCSALKAVLKRVFRQLQISGNEAVARALGALFSSGLRNTAQFLDQDLSAILFDAAEQNEAEIAKLKEAILLAILPHRADGKRKSPHWSRLLAVWMSGQNEHGLKLREALIKSLFFYLPEPEQNAFLGGVLAMTKDNTHKTPQAFLGTLKLSPGRKIQAFLSFLPDAWTQRNAELLQVQSYQFPIHLPLGGKDLGHFSFNGAYFACLVQRGGLLRLFRAHRYSEGVNQDKYPAAQSKILLWAPVEGITPIDDPSQPLRTFHVQQEGSSCEIHITADAKCRKVKSQDAVIPAAELPPALRALRLLSCVQSAESESLYLGIRQISPTLLAHVSVQMDGDQVDVTDTGLVFLEHGSLHSVICRPDGSWAIAYADGRVTYWAD